MAGEKDLSCITDDQGKTKQNTTPDKDWINMNTMSQWMKEVKMEIQSNTSTYLIYKQEHCIDFLNNDESKCFSLNCWAKLLRQFKILNIPQSVAVI